MTTWHHTHQHQHQQQYENATAYENPTTAYRTHNICFQRIVYRFLSIPSSSTTTNKGSQLSSVHDAYQQHPFDSTLPAINSGMRYDPPSPSSPQLPPSSTTNLPPSSFHPAHAHLTRHTRSPASRSRPRSRPPSSSSAPFPPSSAANGSGEPWNTHSQHPTIIKNTPPLYFPHLKTCSPSPAFAPPFPPRAFALAAEGVRHASCQFDIAPFLRSSPPSKSNSSMLDVGGPNGNGTGNGNASSLSASSPGGGGIMSNGLPDPDSLLTPGGTTPVDVLNGLNNPSANGLNGTPTRKDSLGEDAQGARNRELEQELKAYRRRSRSSSSMEPPLSDSAGTAGTAGDGSSMILHDELHHFHGHGHMGRLPSMPEEGGDDGDDLMMGLEDDMGMGMGMKGSLSPDSTEGEKEGEGERLVEERGRTRGVRGLKAEVQSDDSLLGM
ncbi:uncharacterized protein LACBIDRAFT_328342 [Laccaria bicolor S238N-H82]|uniref:Predicted protein n=1 Tax=Laccaria bicolor (strain S238N-H82 / ATCC MYA-4686) TaxID=486041 RepID=B0DEK9_LACBS|nr:uncharacterized protein LACBIDRAFT_328342 [Laccaria bicolor S238N-H82]EDR06952.1 predicted protein [Laccaria bicolor S238N-H82]|eukprot:XP_001882325.1 predicted protein [Laccaria bicolor S238N-H82]